MLVLMELAVPRRFPPYLVFDVSPQSKIDKLLVLIPPGLGYPVVRDCSSTTERVSESGAVVRTAVLSRLGREWLAQIVLQQFSQATFESYS